MYLLYPDALTYHLGSLANNASLSLPGHLGPSICQKLPFEASEFSAWRAFAAPPSRQVYLFCPLLFLGASVVHLWSIWSLGKLIKTSQLSQWIFGARESYTQFSAEKNLLDKLTCEVLRGIPWCSPSISALCVFWVSPWWNLIPRGWLGFLHQPGLLPFREKNRERLERCQLTLCFSVSWRIRVGKW